ncbi:hypothetical protein C2I27_03270 [Priestia megaterium]|uniref:hypothetical protein n=1 Tax=Priestia megaterium TaxID=1404 RepID=UPI000D518512|nr:hypothetical protein [Priestia megaterium]PVC76056.1 hypothetical protein C2I27_03270 [Priestia megaterium]
MEQAGTSFMQINEAVQHVVDQIQQIGSAIHNLAKDTLEVQQAIHEVNGIAEEAARARKTYQLQRRTACFHGGNCFICDGFSEYVGGTARIDCKI